MSFDDRSGLQALLQVGLGRHQHIDEAIPEQSGTADDKFRFRRKTDFLPDIQLNRYALHGGENSGVLGHIADARPAEENIGAGQKSAGIGEVDLQTVEFLQALAEAAEIDNEKRDNGQPEEDEKADFGFDAGVAVVHGSGLLV